MSSGLLCTPVDEKFERYCGRRYFARVGVFRRSIRCADKFLSQKSNIYKNSHTNQLYRFQLKIDHFPMMIMYNSIKNRGSPVMTELSYGQLPNVSSALDCWITSSIFTVYRHKIYYLELTANQNHHYLHSSSNLVHKHLLLASRRSDNMHDLIPCRCVVLPWFDRIGRMKFEKYLIEFHSPSTEFHSSKAEFHSHKAEFHSSFIFLALFVHQYL
jgi:hypothetical protein